MPETRASKVIVGHFDHVLWFHRLPLRRPFCRPSAGTAWSISRKASIVPYSLELVRKRRLILGLDA
jgi:hypothetical protein